MCFLYHGISNLTPVPELAFLRIIVNKIILFWYLLVSFDPEKPPMETGTQVLCILLLHTVKCNLTECVKEEQLFCKMCHDPNYVSYGLVMCSV